MSDQESMEARGRVKGLIRAWRFHTLGPAVVRRILNKIKHEKWNKNLAKRLLSLYLLSFSISKIHFMWESTGACYILTVVHAYKKYLYS